MNFASLIVVISVIFKHISDTYITVNNYFFNVRREIKQFQWQCTVLSCGV